MPQMESMTPDSVRALPQQNRTRMPDQATCNRVAHPVLAAWVFS
jgi:hypothetical protein